MENDKIFIEVCGYDARQYCQHRKKQRRPRADHLRQHPAHICFQNQQQRHTNHDQPNTDASQGKSSQKQSPYILHMSNFPVIEELSWLPIHNGRNMKIFPVATQISHHLVRYIKQITHFHVNIV